MNPGEALPFNYQNSDLAPGPIHLLLNSAGDFNRCQQIKKMALLWFWI